MKLKKLIKNVEVQKMINQRLAAGEKFEVIMIRSGEKMVFGGDKK